MKKKNDAKDKGMPFPNPPGKQLLDERAEKYLREGGKIEDMPEGKLKDKDPQALPKALKGEQ
ncbi:MAG: hypothetical protein H7Y42_17020 [Chitinophagaceae bacterium]|nr:hypothetical protein [Chitinophagaceae bacterium]